MLWTLLAIFVLFVIFYIIGLVDKKVNTVDIAYGLGYIVAAILPWILSDDGAFLIERKIIITVFIILWGARIAVFLTFRSFGKDEKTKEDRRFKIMRDDWGKTFWWRSFVQLYISQVILVFIIGFPAIVTNSSTEVGLVVTDYIGIGIWIVGFFFEFTADLQMLLFKRKPENKGKVMTKGLWKFSRHPNYFGEITMWLGIFFVGLSPYRVLNFVGVISPIIIALALIFVSGIPLAEKRYENNEEYQEYKKRTSALIPWIPRRK
jgi:steroid 5-alpha reductase family enzyme